jgi:hypothetical protein
MAQLPSCDGRRYEIKEMVEALISLRYVTRLYNEDVYIYVYDYITEVCRQQAEVIQNHDNENVRNIGRGEGQHKKYKRLKLGGGQTYDRSSD